MREFIAALRTEQKYVPDTKYRGEDDWENRKKCEKAGCDIGGTASCPTEGGYQVCYVILDPQDPANYLSWRFGLDHLSDQ